MAHLRPAHVAHHKWVAWWKILDPSSYSTLAKSMNQKEEVLHDRLKCVCTMYKVLRAALIIAIPELKNGLTLSNGSNRKAWGGLVRLIHTMVDVALAEGADAVAKLLKGIANDARRLVLGERDNQKNRRHLRSYLRGHLTYILGRPDRLEIVAGLARSLPVPPPEDPDELVRNILSRLTKPWSFGNLPSSIKSQTVGPVTESGFLVYQTTYLAAFKEYSRRFAGKYLKKKPDFATYAGPPNTSACFEATRKDGGVDAMVRKAWLKNPRSRLLFNDPPKRDAFLEGCTFEEQCEAYKTHYNLTRRGYITTALTEASKLPPAPPQAVTGITERGWKRRYVTKGPWSLQVTGTAINRWLVQGLAQFGPCKDTLTGADPLLSLATKIGTKPEKWWKRKELVSSDLSSASDWIPIEMASACWDGICDGARVDQTWRKLGHQTIGQMSIQTPEGPVVTSRGILMGMPLTWPILSLINCFCAEYSGETRRTNPRHLHRFNHTLQTRYRTCGDDLFGAFTRTERSRYYFNLSISGLHVNQEKNAVVPATPNAGLVFTEEIWRIRSHLTHSDAWHRSNPGSRRFTLEKVGKVRLSALLRARHLTIEGLEGGKKNEDPAVYQLGPSLRDAVKELPEGSKFRRHVLQQALAYHSTTVRKIFQTGAPPFVSPTFGGWGLPHPKGDEFGWKKSRRTHRKAIAVALTGRAGAQGKDLNALRQHLILAAPSENQRKADGILSGIRKTSTFRDCKEPVSTTKFRVRLGPTPDDAPGAVLANWHDFEKTMRASLGGFTAMLADSSRLPQKIRYQIRSSARRSHREANRLAARWASVNPIRLSTAFRLRNRLHTQEYVTLPEHRVWNVLLHGKGWRQQPTPRGGPTLPQTTGA